MRLSSTVCVGALALASTVCAIPPGGPDDMPDAVACSDMNPCNNGFCIDVTGMICEGDGCVGTCDSCDYTNPSTECCDAFPDMIACAGTCSDSFNAVLSKYSSDLENLILSPASAQNLCASTRWTEEMHPDLKAVLHACDDDYDLSVAALKPFINMLNDLPCVMQEGQYCWESFAPVVQFPAIQIFAAVKNNDDLQETLDKLDFTTNDDLKEKICSADSKKCFKSMNRKLYKAIRHADDNRDQIPVEHRDTVDSVVAQFKKYVSEVQLNCESIIRDDKKKWCAEEYLDRFGYVVDGIRYQDKKPAKPEKYCEADGTLQDCIELGLSVRQSLGQLDPELDLMELRTECCDLAEGCDSSKVDILQVQLALTNLKPEYASADSTEEEALAALKQAAVWLFRAVGPVTIETVEDFTCEHVECTGEKKGAKVTMEMEFLQGTDPVAIWTGLEGLVALVLAQLGATEELPTLQFLPNEARFTEDEPIVAVLDSSSIQLKQRHAVTCNDYSDENASQDYPCGEHSELKAERDIPCLKVGGCDEEICCDAWECTCDGGFGSVGATCPANGDEHCDSCNEGYKLTTDFTCEELGDPTDEATSAASSLSASLFSASLVLLGVAARA